MAERFESFEDGRPANFSEQASGTSIDPNSSFDGSQSYRIGVTNSFNSSPEPLASWRPNLLSGGKEITEFEWYYNESSGQYGSGMALFDSSGNHVFGMFTNNPEWTFVRDRGDTRQINGGDGYDRWVRVRIFNIDWSARQAEFEWEDQQSGTLETGTVSLGSNGTDVEEVYFTASYKGPSNGGYTGGAVSCNWDAITIKTSGSSSTLTEEALREGVAVNEESTKSTRVSHGRVQSPTSQSTKTENLNFEPDVVQFRVTSTNSQFNNVTRPETTDFGWGHGVAKFNEDGSTEQYAVSHGSGSNSTNGHISEASSVYGVLQLVTDVSGDNLRGKVEASVKKAGKGFELEFTEVQEQQQILYTAYKFGGGDVDVGFFNAPNSSGTKSITEPGFQPNFLRLFATPSLNSMDSTNNELSNGTDVGWGQGVAVENSSGVNRGA